jgi:dihydroneopterin aldolase
VGHTNTINLCNITTRKHHNYQSNMDTTQTSSRQPDKVFVQGVRVDRNVGLNCWGENKAQPVIVTAWVYKSIKSAAETDTIDDTVDYRRILDGAILLYPEQIYATKEYYVYCLAHYVKCSSGQTMGELQVEFPKALRRADSGIIHRATFDSVVGQLEPVVKHQEVIVPRIQVSCIIGILAAERIVKQPILLSLSAKDDLVGNPPRRDLSPIFERLVEVCYRSILLSG